MMNYMKNFYNVKLLSYCQFDTNIGALLSSLLSQLCEYFKLYLCVIGIGNTALPFTNEHNSESTDSINSNISLKIKDKLIYNIKWEL